MKKIFLFAKKHLRNTFYSNVWIAFAAGCATFQTSQILELNSIYLPFFVACSTLFVYNFQRLVKLQQKPHFYSAGRNNWIYRNRRLLTALTIISALLLLLLSFNLTKADIVFLAIPAILSVFYAVPLKLSSRKHLEAMRSMPYLKLFLVAFTWSFSTVLLPAVHSYGLRSVLWSDNMLLAVEQFAFIAAITIPFDIRDLKFDSPAQKTIPQLFGVAGSLTFAMILLSLSFVCLYFLYQSTFLSLNGAIGLAIGNGIAGIGILLTKTTSRELFFTGFLDGTIVFKCILFLLFKSYI